MVSRVVTGVAVAAVTFSMAACGGSTPQTESESPAATAPAADEHAGHAAGGRVYFVSPKDGDTIKPLHTFEFGSDMYNIAAVPAGEVTEAQVRADTGHFHLGVDTECLPPGEIIPKADPWIHFGTGNNNIEMQLKPGPHTFSVQAGDDMHRTVAGLCETITVTVAE
jgi:hypothetical protein